MGRREKQLLNRRKLRALVHYVCHQAPRERLGKVKLHKILYYADINAYVRFGEGITGEVYVKQKFGPVSLHLEEVLEELAEDGLVVLREAEGDNDSAMSDDSIGEAGSRRYRKGEFVSVRKPVLEGFLAEEVEVIDGVIEWICFNHTARSISQHSHDEVWNLLEMGEEIPYATAYVSKLGVITQDDIEWGLAEIKRLGLVSKNGGNAGEEKDDGAPAD